MVNQIKTSGEAGFALQVTKQARSAGLVEENDEGQATYLATVRVFAFEGLLIVVDIGEVSSAETAEVVVAAARDTETIYRAMDASIQIAGNGYQVQLPSAEDAGFTEGDRAPCTPASGMLFIHRDDGTSAARQRARLVRDLDTIRSDQVN